MNVILTEKQRIRKAQRELRDQLPIELRELQSRQACDHLISLTESMKFRSVMVYVPLRSELNTWPYIEWCWHQQIKVLVPRCDVSTQTIVVYPLYNKDQLHSGAYGILEPNPELLTPVATIPDAIVVPGLAFNNMGQRLGYGGGYYDRYYERIGKQAQWIGIGYEQQWLSHIPTDAHDMILNNIVSNKGIETFS